MLPFPLTEPKPGLNPSFYRIPAAADDGIGILVVEDGFHLVVIPMTDEKTPPMRVTDTSERIAQSLVDDYISGCLAISYDVDEANNAVPVPGLFWVPGEKSISQIEKEYTSKVSQAKRNTRAWFKNLVMMADDDWAKNHQYKAITDLQRFAAKYLKLEREWNYDAFKEQANLLCWSCKMSVNPQAILCSNCKAILNVAEYEKNKERFAKV